MPVSEVLKGLRQDGYKKEAPNETPQGGGPRLIKLTEEEVKSLEPYQAAPGEEIVLEVSGRLEGTDFTVMNVKYAQGGPGAAEEKEMAASVMGKPPMMQNQTMPSPS